jgi:hypothetical protein
MCNKENRIHCQETIEIPGKLRIQSNAALRCGEGCILKQVFVRKIIILTTVCCLSAIFVAAGPSAGEKPSLTSWKLNPSYFVSNAVRTKNGKATGKFLLKDNPEAIAFVQTLRGRVIFTPTGAYIGITSQLKGKSAMSPDPLGAHFSRPSLNKLKTVVIKSGFGNTGAKGGKSTSVHFEEQIGGTFNFLIGKKKNWHTGVLAYRKLVYDNVWNGINIEYIGYTDRLEYRVQLSPGADPEQMVMDTGAEALTIDTNGNLIAKYANADLKMSAPKAWQEINGKQVPINVAFVPLTSGRYTFSLGSYNSAYPLTIDPTLEWSTYFGSDSFGDAVCGMGVDSQDNVIVAGYVYSASVPTTPDALRTERSDGNADAFVSKFSSDGTLLFSTYFGGTWDQQAYAMDVDDGNNIYITGYTYSTDFPATPGAFSETLSGPKDAFVAKLNPNGDKIIYATYLGGSYSDYANAISVGPDGCAYITGQTSTSDFPTTEGVLDTGQEGYLEGGGFLTKLNATGTALAYSTYLGINGTAAKTYGNGVDVDQSGCAYVTGSTTSVFPTTNGAFMETQCHDYKSCFVAKINPTGTEMMYGTFLSGYCVYSFGLAIVVDKTGCAYVTGFSDGGFPGFPVTENAIDDHADSGGDAFVAKLNPTGSGILFATYLGGTGMMPDSGRAIVLAPNGDVIVGGESGSDSDFPIAGPAFQYDSNGSYDGFVARLSSDGSVLKYSSLLGGTGSDMIDALAVDSLGQIIVGGKTRSTDFPLFNSPVDDANDGHYDAFVAKFPLESSLSYLIVGIAEGNGSVDQIGTGTYTLGEGTTITATPGSGWTFDHWSGDASGSDNPLTVQMDSNKIIQAHFTGGKYTITASASDGGSIAPSGSVVVSPGSDQTFTITPDSGFYLNTLQVDGDSVIPVTTYMLSNIKKDHNISARFVMTGVPNLDSFTANVYSGQAPLSVNFHCSAWDTDGSGISSFIWQITGPQNDTVITRGYNMNYQFLSPGNYAVSVTVTSGSGETTTASLRDSSYAESTINVSAGTPIHIPIPNPLQIGSQLKNTTTTVHTTAANGFDTPVAVTLNALDANGQVLKSIDITVPANGSSLFSTDGFDGLDYDTIQAVEDRHLLLFSKVATDSGMMTAELSDCFSDVLLIPHIAEEVQYWDTFAYLSNNNPVGLDLTVAGETQSWAPVPSGIINLETLLPTNVSVARAWGKLAVSEVEPQDSDTLSGFEMFVKNGSDGAATELVNYKSTMQYIPHIPEETSIFWTGFAFLNSNRYPATVTALLYDDNGNIVGTKKFLIPPESKTKGLVSDLFPSEAGVAKWGTFQSNIGINIIEIYGTYHAGICGLTLPEKATPWGILPDVLTGPGNWTGIALTNVTDKVASITLQLVGADGQVKAEKTASIDAMHRFKVVVADCFAGATIESGDTVRYVSDQPVIALEVSGDLDRTFMTALTGSR